MAALAATFKLSTLFHNDFDAVFYPGGHGPLWDLAEDPASIALIERSVAAGRREPTFAVAVGIAKLGSINRTFDCFCKHRHPLSICISMFRRMLIISVWNPSLMRRM